MIPRAHNLRSISACLKRTVPTSLSCPAIRLCRLQFSTESQPKSVTDEFWSIPEPKSKESAVPSEETRDFKHLLDSLFDRPVQTIVPEPRVVPPTSSRTRRRTESIIEERLLDMVIRNKKPYKTSSPLPRSLMGPLYGTPQNTQQNHSSVQWNHKRVVDKDISLRDQELNAVNAILDSKDSHELLKRVLEEINMTGTYPPYYSRILAKSIEHAAMGFGDPYLALAIFEQAKTRSVESYVTGCTVEVYNAMLLLRWQLWRDVYGMLHLIEEMSSHGISYDQGTRRIVLMVASEVDGDLLALEEKRDNTWSVDARRSANVMTMLVGKWMVK